jgi:hypothetical protein
MHRNNFDHSLADVIAAAAIVFIIGMLTAAFVNPPWMWWLTDVSMGWRIFAFAGSVLVLTAVARLLVLVLPLLDSGYGRHAKATT